MPSRSRAAATFLNCVALVLALVACGGARPTETPAPGANAPTSVFVSPTPTYAVEVTKDIEYLTLLGPGAPVQKLDVYAPAGPGLWPVVVLMHTVFQSKDTVAYSSLAKELAGRGVVVFVPSWRFKSATVMEAARDNGREYREMHESCVCTVRFARERAAGYGGDPGRITVFGHEEIGLETAFLGDDLLDRWEELALLRGGPAPQAECVAGEVTAHVDAYVGFGGDFEIYEVLKDQDPELWELTSPFALIGPNPGLRVYIVRGELDAPTYTETAMEYHEALVKAGYDASMTVLGTSALWLK
jgi:hypothetical protein